MANAVARIFDLGKIDAEIAGALAHRRRGLHRGLRHRRSRGTFPRRRRRAPVTLPPVGHAPVVGAAILAGAAFAGLAAILGADILVRDDRVQRLGNLGHPVRRRRLGRRGRGSGSRLPCRLDHHQHRADRDHVADLARDFEHLARYRAFHLDRRLVGHHVGELLILGHGVARLHVPGDDLRLRNAFADIGQFEFVAGHPVSPSEQL